MKSGNPNFLEPSGPLQACNGIDLPLPLYRFENLCLARSKDCPSLRLVMSLLVAKWLDGGEGADVWWKSPNVERSKSWPSQTVTKSMMIILNVVCGYDWINPVRDRIEILALVSTVMSLRFYKTLEITWSTEWLLSGFNYPLSYGVPVRERYGSTLLPATREQHDQNCTQSH